MADYSVPGLDKGLDVLQALAGHDGGLGQAELARLVDRSVNEIFRVLATLERRGWVLRDTQTGLYEASTMMFQLAHRHPPLRSLVTAALGPMRRLNELTRQSCNLAVLSQNRVLIVAQVESPGDFGFRVRVGAEFGVESTATGAVLLAYAAAEVRAAYLMAEPNAPLEQRLPAVRRRGYSEETDPLGGAIVDLVHPVLGPAGLVAALTVPYIATSYSTVSAEAVRGQTGAAAAEISLTLRPERLR